MLFQGGSTIKRPLSSTATNRHLISHIPSPPMRRKTKCEKHDLEAVWKEISDELAGHKTNITWANYAYPNPNLSPAWSQ